MVLVGQVGEGKGTAEPSVSQGLHPEPPSPPELGQVPGPAPPCPGSSWRSTVRLHRRFRAETWPCSSLPNQHSSIFEVPSNVLAGGGVTLAGQCGSSLESLHSGDLFGCWVCALHVQELSGMGLEGEKFHIKPLSAGIEQGQRVAGAGSCNAPGNSSRCNV